MSILTPSLPSLSLSPCPLILSIGFFTFFINIKEITESFDIWGRNRGKERPQYKLLASQQIRAKL